jgi:RND family efflux transporter MFP subunit
MPITTPPAAARAPRGPRRRRLWPVAAGVLALAGATLALGLQVWPARPIPVMTEVVSSAPVTRILAVNGRIVSRHSVDVRPPMGGALAAVGVAEGDSVEARDELARLDSAAQAAQVRQAQAGLDAALVAQAQARATFARADALGAFVSRAALENAGRTVEAAAQDVARARAQVDQARVQLEGHTIRAPMTGSVLAVHVEPGQIVDPATVLMTIADLGQLAVATDVDEAYAVQVRVGQPAALRLAGEAQVRGGQVARVAQRVDPAIGGLAVEIAFDTHVSAPVGLTVTANIVVETRTSALTVPRSALLGQGAERAVLVVEGGRALRREVSLVDWPAARLIVTAGLAEGDMVILDPATIPVGAAVRTAGP